MLSDLVVPPWFKLALRLVPYVIIGGLAVALMLTRATLTETRLSFALQQSRQNEAAEKDKEANAEKAQRAAEDFAQRIQSIQPIILHNTDTVHEYSQTPDGAKPCLSSDRVHGIEDTRSQLFPSTEGSSRTLQTVPSP